jgi:hypothetical protein
MTAPPRTTPLLVGLAAGATLVDGWLALRLATGTMSLGVAALAHAVVVAVLAAWTMRSPASRADLRLPLILTVMTATLGPLGSAGTLVAAVMARRYARTAAPFEEWYASLFPDLAAGEGVVPLRSGADARSSVAPFADILGFGTLDQKQELIGLIANEFRPAFAPTLRLALTDTNNAVRVQAASAITRVEDEFQQHSLALADEVRRHPGDARRVHALAAYHDEYARSGILDVDRARDSRETARRAYLDYLQLRPGDHVARAAVGRLLVQDGRYQDAADWLVEAIAAPEGRVHALLLWMEAQFNLGRFAEVRWAAVTHAAELIDRDDTPLLARETLKLWSGAA